MKKDFSLVSFVIQKALELWPIFFEEYKLALNNKEGLYFSVCDLTNHYNSAGLIVGRLEDNERPEKMMYAWEKVCRLLTGAPFHMTSFATQNYSEKKFGGGIKVYNLIAAASNLPPEYDHLFVLRVLKATGNLGDQENENIQAEFERYKDIGK